MIKRDLEDKIRERLNQGKAIVIYGARQVGKTTLLHAIFDDMDDVLWLDGDAQSTREMLAYASREAYAPIVGNHKYVIIDEAQRIEDIGLKLKILHDNFGQSVQFVATGSSSFELANKINEPMTGRKWTFLLSPFTARELCAEYSYAGEVANLRNRLVYGSYPAVVKYPEVAKSTITELASDNLYKDVLNLSDIIKTDKLRKILQALAYQIGSQVSMNELAQLVELDRKTVDKYISLLEQAFVIFRLPSYARNLRNELKSSQKIYFYDTGIRNALIGAFQAVDFRDDTGRLFENYVIAEYKKMYPDENFYFWRNTEQQEVDLLIAAGGEIAATEIKWNEKKSTSAKMPKIFTETYTPASETFISQANYLQVLTGAN